jgi:hypothetical protein
LIAKLSKKINLKNTLNLSFSFFTNFPIPSHKLNLSFSNQTYLVNEKIFTKNFLVFLCLIKFFSRENSFSQNEKILKKSAFFVLTSRKKSLTLLRAPFRHKLSKKHVFIKFYKLNYNISLELTNVTNLNS